MGFMNILTSSIFVPVVFKGKYLNVMVDLSSNFLSSRSGNISRI